MSDEKVIVAVEEVQINISRAKNGFMVFVRFKGDKDGSADKYVSLDKDGVLGILAALFEEQPK